MADKNYYEMLQVEEDATPDQIKNSYRKLAKKYHPDANKQNPDAATIFKMINEAYETLSEPDKRAAYDKTLIKYVSKLRAPNTSLDGSGIFLDDYDNFPEKNKLDDGGGDVVVNIPVMPTELVTGTVKEVKVERKEVCDACGGSGSKSSGPCQLCHSTGKLKFYIDTAKGIETHERRCKTCFGTGVQVLKECHKCEGHGMLTIQKPLKVPVPKGSRDGLVMIKKGDGNRSRIKDKAPGNLKLVVKLMKLKTAAPVKK